MHAGMRAGEVHREIAGAVQHGWKHQPDFFIVQILPTASHMRAHTHAANYPCACVRAFVCVRAGAWQRTNQRQRHLVKIV